MEIPHEHAQCLCCNAEKLEPLTRFESAHLVKCTSCGFVFSKRIPSAQELKSYYDETYDVTRYFSPITRKRYHELLDTFEPYRKTNKILDVGCGYGFFLEVARERGWEIQGVEFSEPAAAHCREENIPVHTGEINSARFAPESFDVIVSLEVIEHLNNPLEYLRKNFELLRKGGAMYVSTPNFNAYLRHRLKEKYDVIEYPNHLCYYTVKTLSNVFKKTGFQVRKVQTTGISVTRVKTSKGVSNQEFVSETSHDEMLRYRIEKNGFLRLGKRIANFGLSTFRIGLNIKGLFVKP